MTQDPSLRSSSGSKRPSKECEQESNDDSDSDKAPSKKRRGKANRGTGGLSDHNERKGEERGFAKKSPHKGKQRVNSQVSSVIPHRIYCELINHSS